MNDGIVLAEINSKEIAKTLFDARQEFIVLGVCGKTGSGVSTVAKILGKNFEELNLPKPCEECHAQFDKTEYKILHNFAKHNWKSFYIIKTSALITLTALIKSPEDFAKYIISIGNFNGDEEKYINSYVYDFYKKNATFKLNDSLFENLNLILDENQIKGLNEFLKNNDIKYKKEESNEEIYSFEITQLAKLFFKYKEIRGNKSGINNYLVHEILFQFIYSKDINGLQYLVNKFWDGLLDNLDKKITTVALQGMGNNLRITKDDPFNLGDTNEFVNDGFLSIAELINISIKLIRDCKMKKVLYCKEHIKEGMAEETLFLKKLSNEKRAFIVIDSIKNPFESNYLKDRYSNYYLMTVYTDENKRNGRLEHNKKLEQKDIKAIDLIEQLSEFKKFQNKYKESKNDEDKKKELFQNFDIFKSILERMMKLNSDSVYPFIMQNIESCIELADIFVNNEDDSRNNLKLKKILLRYVSLIMCPGLVLPTAVERCMQIANTAKSCSGCISRQVGAVLTDASYNLKAIGWNHVPENHMPCLYRDINEVYSHCNEDAYSCFENDDKNEFQNKIEQPVKTYYSKNPEGINDTGRTIPYCFKDIYNEILGVKNQIHPRALHAEETAFLNLNKMGTNGIEGGYLFTTSSPCELCAKKAMYMGISTVYYVQPYPGISGSHVLNAGPPEKRPSLVLYTGAIGRAYTQLYTPLIPKKDELELWLRHKISIKEEIYKMSGE